MQRMNREEYRQVAHRFNQIPKKLDAESAKAIRTNRKGLTDKQQAELYGVHKNTIYSIRKGLTWGSV
jgi:DNA-binding transcriptional regulator YiaG